MKKRDDLELERTINLTGEQFRSLKGVFNMNDMAKRFIAGLLEEFLERQQDRESEMWDFVAELCGYKNHEEMSLSGRSAQLDFATRQIKLSKKSTG